MSKFIKAAHACILLVGVEVVDLTQGRQEVKIPIATDKMYDRFVIRAKMEFEHGETKATDAKFGGIYNLLRSACVLINNDEPHYKKTGLNLYTDCFKRTGREDNELNYADLDDEFTQNIEYCFAGTESVLGGVKVPDGAFALDLRHTKAGNQTYNSAELVLEIGEIGDVFNTVNNTSLKSLTIEVYGVELHHDATTSKVLDITTKRYAEIVTREQREKIIDTTQPVSFRLEKLGSNASGVYLSDISIVQVDEAGAPIPFTDEEEVVEVTVDGFPYCNYPIWMLRRAQNGRRIEDVPPNVLFIPITQEVTGFGGLSHAELTVGANLKVKPSKIAGQTGSTHLNVEKSYTYKAG